jgi:putative ATP-dependent endonuclease of OLD family
MSKSGDTPQTSEGITIELWFREDKADEWGEAIIQDLQEIVQLDPEQDIDAIGLRLSSSFDADSGAGITDFTFLSQNGQPLQVPLNMRQRFLTYVKLYYLSALRDVDDFFSPRSSFWGRILRDIQISDEERERIRNELAQINEALINSDPRLEQIREALENPQKMMGAGAAQRTVIRVLPAQLWDLMSKAEVAITTRGGMIEFPLYRHGQGTQSLSVLSLFQAFIDVYMKPQFEEETEAIITLEEPEAHLHPQATRVLSTYLQESSTQKIISTHSPFFLQGIPLTQIRMFRRIGAASKVLYIKRSFSVQLPEAQELVDFCVRRSSKFIYHRQNQTLTVYGRMDEDNEYRRLLPMYQGNAEAIKAIKTLFEESQIYISGSELVEFEKYSINRVRGEILFARAWFLCEGQSDYFILNAFADLLGKSLDRYGIALIDFKNSGAPPSVFVRLAQTFEIPWVMLCDSDDAGNSYMSEVSKLGFTDDTLQELAYQFPRQGTDLETFLVENGFAEYYVSIFEATAKVSPPRKGKWVIAEERTEEEGVQRIFRLTVDERDNYFVEIAGKGTSTEEIPSSDGRFDPLARQVIIAEIQKDKVGYANKLAHYLRSRHAENPVTVPPFFSQIIDKIIEKADL